MYNSVQASSSRWIHGTVLALGDLQQALLVLAIVRHIPAHVGAECPAFWTDGECIPCIQTDTTTIEVEEQFVIRILLHTRNFEGRVAVEKHFLFTVN